MTLVEILVVMSIIAVITGAAVLGTGGVGASRLRAAAATIVALTRVAVTRTNATGYPVRLACDLDKHQVWLEEASSSKALRTNLTDETSREKAKEQVEQARLRAVKEDAEAVAERLLEGKTIAKAGFHPVKGLELAGDRVGEKRELGNSIEFRQIQVEHDGEPRKSGMAYLYFWPGGETEWSSIQLRRSGEKDGFSILISPLTGRAKIERGSVDLPEATTNGEIDESEVER